VSRPPPLPLTPPRPPQLPRLLPLARGAAARRGRARARRAPPARELRRRAGGRAERAANPMAAITLVKHREAQATGRRWASPTPAESRPRAPPRRAGSGNRGRLGCIQKAAYKRPLYPLTGSARAPRAPARPARRPARAPRAPRSRACPRPARRRRGGGAAQRGLERAEARARVRGAPRLPLLQQRHQRRVPAGWRRGGGGARRRRARAGRELGARSGGDAQAAEAGQRG
jgi:hypothetical protein